MCPFAVLSGPNAGETGLLTTDENGQASFTYTGTGGAGRDSIQCSLEPHGVLSNFVGGRLAACV